MWWRSSVWNLVLVRGRPVEDGGMEGSIGEAIGIE